MLASELFEKLGWKETHTIRDFARVKPGTGEDQILQKLIEKYNIEEIILEYPRIVDFLNELFKELK